MNAGHAPTCKAMKISETDKLSGASRDCRRKNNPLHHRRKYFSIVLRRKNFLLHLRIAGILKSTGLILLIYLCISRAANCLSQQFVVRTYCADTWSDDGTAEAEKLAHAYNEALYAVSANDAWNDSPAAHTRNDSSANEKSWDSSVDILSSYNGLLNVGGDGMMGYIEIPCLGVSMPILHHASEASLQRGAGHLEGTSLPVGGKNTHTVIVGHRGLPSMKAFTDLDQMKEGDIFILHILHHELHYQVDQVITVLPSETEALAIQSGEDYATLLTCTPYGVNSHRLLVRGRRVFHTDQPMNSPAYAYSDSLLCDSVESPDIQLPTADNKLKAHNKLKADSKLIAISKSEGTVTAGGLLRRFFMSWRFSIGLGVFAAITGVTFILYSWKNI